MSRRRATDVKYNSYVKMPKPANTKTEVQIEVVREEVMKVFERYKTSKTNEKGQQKSNLSRKEIGGLTKLRKRIQEGEIVILRTDKSSRMAVMDMEQ